MSDLLKNYFTIQRIYNQINNRGLSLFALYDSQSRISLKSKIQRFVFIRESTIDSYSYVGHGSNVFRTNIGRFCSISRNVNIGLGTHPINFISTSPIFFEVINATGYVWANKSYFDGKPLPTLIGNDVWIGMNATITGGVNIGNGAIIAAHSVVTKDVPPYAIVAGVPAKIIKYRFNDDIIKKLERLKWWDLPEQKIKKVICYFQRELTLEDIYDLSDNLSEVNSS